MRANKSAIASPPPSRQVSSLTDVEEYQPKHKEDPFAVELARLLFRAFQRLADQIVLETLAF